ncbi:MAG: MFS transporter, partial [Clostridia bacterium]|nr:MFS transporter [Clostridia bacterium]
KANAIINLMGTAGGILVLILGILFRTSAIENLTMGYMPFFGVVCGIMLLALILFMATVREPELVRKMQEDSKKYGYSEGAENTPEISHRKLGPDEKKSMFFILASIVLWFMGYNAVTSKYSVYATTLLHKNYNLTLLIAQAAAIVSYIPVGIVASKVGRKKTIIAGVLMLAVAFGTASFLREDSPALLMNAMFALAGIGWATINVNSFPMVVEMCSDADVGWFTGIYYAASMSAQIVTPVLSGMIMDRFGLTSLFPYSVVFVALAFVTMLFVRHGDSKPPANIDLSALQTPDVD